MRFLADENIPKSLIGAIRRKGHSIMDLKEENLLGISDDQLIKIAKNEERIIITFDKDFSDLNHFPLKKHKGIVLLRYKDKSPQNVVNLFIYLLDSPAKEKFEDSLCEAYDNYVKIRK